MYSITSIARYLSGISNFLDLRTEVKWSEHFQIDNKIFRCCHSSNRIEMDYIETEVGTFKLGSVTIEIYFNAPISVHCPNNLDIRTFLGCITLSVIIL